MSDTKRQARKLVEKLLEAGTEDIIEIKRSTIQDLIMVLVTNVQRIEEKDSEGAIRSLNNVLKWLNKL